MPLPIRVAVLATAWFRNSHADVIIPMLVDGWGAEGDHETVGLRVVSVYIEQGDTSRGEDLGVPFLRSRGIHHARTPGEALGAGGPGVVVDGVLIIGEHGDYAFNEYGQRLYPRRRLIESALAAMNGGGRWVPIFNDKGLSYSGSDARAIAEAARGASVGLGAGSSVPLAWRQPQGAQWAFGAPMSAAVAVGWGGRESYGFHALELLQSWVERREGGESGVRSVRGWDAEAARKAVELGIVDSELLADAVSAGGAALAEVLDDIEGAIEIDHLDGLKSWVVQFGKGVDTFSVSARGVGGIFGCAVWLDDEQFTHFGFLVRQAAALFATGRPSIPTERTRLTTSVLDAAMRSWATCAAVEDEDLAVAYFPTSGTEGTGIDMPRPGSRRADAAGVGEEAAKHVVPEDSASG